VLTNIVLDGQNNLVHSDAFKADHFLERIELFVPVTRNRHVLRLCSIENKLKLLLMFNKEFCEPF